VASIFQAIKSGNDYGMFKNQNKFAFILQLSSYLIKFDRKLYYKEQYAIKKKQEAAHLDDDHKEKKEKKNKSKHKLFSARIAK
jgi:hypothetical protein